MAKQDAQTPITEAEFKAGVTFFVVDKLDPYNLDTYQVHKDGGYITHNGAYYCSILYSDDRGFMFWHSIFGHKNEFRVNFNQCFKAPTI